MPVRTLTAARPGPVLVDAQLLGAAGTITVRTAHDRTTAEITLRTADETGPLADAVANARLDADSTALTAHVQAAGRAGTNVDSGVVGGNRYGVVQNVRNNYGSMIAVSGGDLNIGPGGLTFNGQSRPVSGSTIEILALVPEGSSLTARTQSADVTAYATLATVQVATESGNITAAHTTDVTATTQAGDIHLGRTDVARATTQAGDVTVDDFGGTAHLKSVSGDLRLHAAAGGDVTANTVAGDVTITATDRAIDDGLDIRAHSTAGDVRLPHTSPHHTRGPRRRQP
ncbi:DUF4097 family beta strand repeat-containing protein [Streptomyces sp. BE147]|uniref:DUF4097 family beta strand repeat-containing protein n=1 Tax=Streptomyces sp. BE147 TaxID=3002524 RepID=UPI002E7A104E|nr:DUF4097 family beta strand repeat-containing protein [Streptomyces sp. BE147]MEE1735450.1 DUF4097 family beta strand repeat-containing protein [Streptomyces sp. BE147]